MARTGTATSFLTLLLCHKVVNTNTIYKHLSPKNFCNSVLTRGPDSVVSIATRQWAGPSGVRTSSAARDISRLQNVQTSSGANSVSYSQGTRVISEGENWSGCGVACLLPSTAKVKNKWRYTSKMAQTGTNFPSLSY